MVTKDKDIISFYTTDFRRQYVGATIALLRPRDWAEVQAIVRACARHGVGLVPQGGNTSYCTAANAKRGRAGTGHKPGKMNRVRELDAENHSVIADAGVILSDLQKAAASPVLNLEECMNALLAELYESALINDGTIAASEQQRAEFWHLRESIPEAEVHHGGSVKHDIAVRTSRVAAFVEAAGQLVRGHLSDAILSIYGHVGDGNVHFNIVPPHGADRAAFKRQVEQEISPEIYELAFEMGGRSALNTG